MNLRITLLLVFIGFAEILLGQTSLLGSVSNGEDKEPVAFANVVVYKNGVLITGADTDLDGFYSFPTLDPGTYDVEVSYIGLATQRIKGVQVLAGKSNKLDIIMESDGGLVLEEVIVKEYKVPLIEQDNTTSGSVLTGDQIRTLPTRNINALAATSAGLASSDEGEALNVRGSRSNATDYYVDGIRVRGSLIPESEIDQMQVITGGIEAQYGDVTGGIISITTKGPSSSFSGSVEVESSSPFDAYDNNLVGFNLSGPILKNSNGNSLIGFRMAGRYSQLGDDDPPATDIFRIKEAQLLELENNPILTRRGSPYVAADFLKEEDVDILSYKPFESSARADITAKIDARISEQIDVSITGAYRNSKNQFTPGGWRVLNSHNNPYSYNTSYRANFRFRHRFNQNQGRGSFKNVSYVLQAGVERTIGEISDPRHGSNYFDYGYVGNFDIDWIPTFVQVFNPETQLLELIHTDYRQVLRSYTPGDRNPVLANYNKAMEINFEEGLNGSVTDYLITNLAGTGSLLSRDNFYAPNGTISGIFTNSWGFHSNVGTVYNLYSQTENNTYTFSGSLNFDWVPQKSDFGRHNIQIGFWYEQRVDRSYNVAPRSLWDIARQQANNHIQGIAANPDTVGYSDIGTFANTPLLGLDIVTSGDNKFYQSIREVTGQSLDQYVNVDGLSPEDMELSMFSAKELNDQGVLGYFGHDYLGGYFDGQFEDFFSAVDAEGVRTFPVAPNRPIYQAVYLQDKFTFRDIIFRLGLRVDRYDANTRVLKDNYSLYQIMGAGEFHERFGGIRPGNIGDEYKVYLDEAGNNVTAYRDQDQWYAANGTPVNSPTNLFSGGLVFPRYQDDRVQDNPNFIKSKDFDPSVSFEDYEAQINWMPRLAFSFPISDVANFFAHYDILVQRPASNTLATARDYFYFTDEAGNIKNNPNLKPERTIDYEVGFQQRLSLSSALKIAAYYKEMRDMIQVRTFFPVPIVNQYTTYDNLDFGTVKGFSFQYDLRRTGNVSLQANYTLQFADGTGSNANSQRGLTSRGNLRTLFPLNFDERHRIVANVDYRYGSGRNYSGPRIGDKELLANFGVNLQGILVSGRPYTAQVTPLELGGATTAGSINGSRKPWNLTLNLRVDKAIQLKEGWAVNIYARVSNLLDRKNVINVYPASGSPTDDGFLVSSNGLDKLENISNSDREVEAYLASFQWSLLNPDFFSLPRRIYVGAIFDL